MPRRSPCPVAERRSRVRAGRRPGPARQPRQPPPRRPRPPPAPPARGRRAAAGAVPGGREDRVRQPAARSSQQSAEGKAAVAPRAGARSRRSRPRAPTRRSSCRRNQQKLQTSGSVMNEAARVQLEKDIERQHARKASASSRTRRPRSTSCSRKLQNDFQKKLLPIVEAAREGEGAARRCSARRTPGIVVGRRRAST